jgi:hypothetical protein
VKPAELLQRIARVLRDDVGPAIEAEYPKTQAFMAAVVLQKLGRELALAETHRTIDAADLRSLAADLTKARIGAGVPKRIDDAIERFAAAGDAASLCGVIEALYSERAELGESRFDAWLGRIRATLRAQIDRRLEFAK